KTFSHSSDTDPDQFLVTNSVTETFGLVRSIFEQDGIKMSLDIEPDLHSGVVKGNAGRFQQVLMNLLSNAKDAVAGLNHPEISIQCELISDGLAVTVRDNGRGIPESVLEKIFDPFYTTKEANQGTGLGLSLTNKFVQEMDGKISVDTAMNKGTSFRITIPLSSAKLTLQTETENTATSHLSGLRVLLVDDEIAILDLMAEQLELYGIVTSKAVDGDAALRTISESDEIFDLIISDVKMPNMNGFDFYNEFKSLSLPNTKFVFFTGGISVEYEDKLSALSEDIDGYLYKPAGEEEILKLLLLCFPGTEKENVESAS
ncbi:MAG: response regulator, partial [Bdellovibrionales bacterium]|nr:response regulator [Bdellovibrionales bacterium]